MCSVYVTNLKKFPPFIPEILGTQDGLTYGWTTRKGPRLPPAYGKRKRHEQLVEYVSKKLIGPNFYPFKNKEDEVSHLPGAPRSRPQKTLGAAAVWVSSEC